MSVTVITVNSFVLTVGDAAITADSLVITFGGIYNCPFARYNCRRQLRNKKVIKK